MKKIFKTYIKKGLKKFKNNDFKGAVDDFTKAIELDPKNDEAYYYRGKVKNKLQDFSGAINDYNKALEINPQNNKAKTSLDILYSILERINIDIFANTNTSESSISIYNNDN